MADDKALRSPQDAARVNVHEEHEVAYWTKKWGVTRDQLEAAVREVGVSASALARKFGKG